MASWNVSDIPDQGGRTALITGTSGIGLQTAIALGQAGADVTIAGRSEERGAEAVAAIRAAAPEVQVGFEFVDLAALSSVRALGARLRSERTHLDLLVNNAGLMAVPVRMETVDGFELQIATNYLGPYALTRELLPLLRQGRESRVVTVASLGANSGKTDLDDLQSRRSYKGMGVYNQSKLADLLFAVELQRRSDAMGWQVASMAVHPGLARTELMTKGMGSRNPLAVITGIAARWVGQSAASGALPTLYAATSPDAVGGNYYGPDGVFELRGTPTAAKIPRQAMDQAIAARLWDLTEQLLDARYDALPNKAGKSAEEGDRPRATAT